MFSYSVAPIISRSALSLDLLQEMGKQLLSDFYQQAVQQQRVREGVTLAHMLEWITRFLVSYLSNSSPLFKTRKQKRELVKNGLLPLLLK